MPLSSTIMMTSGRSLFRSLLVLSPIFMGPPDTTPRACSVCTSFLSVEAVLSIFPLYISLFCRETFVFALSLVASAQCISYDTCSASAMRFVFSKYSSVVANLSRFTCLVHLHFVVVFVVFPWSSSVFRVPPFVIFRGFADAVRCDASTQLDCSCNPERFGILC